MSTAADSPAGQIAGADNATHRHHFMPAGSRIFQHVPHPHMPRNVNVIFAAEQAAGNFNQKVATGMTAVFQAMPTFWLIMIWIVTWIVTNATILSFDPLPWPLLLALASVPQLPLMIVIMVGQGLLGRKQELQSDEQFNTTQKTYSDLCQVMDHLSAQDAELLRQTEMLLHILRTSGLPAEQIAAFEKAAAQQPAVSQPAPQATSGS